MSLYQQSVLKSHLSLQDQSVLNTAYKKYVKYFLNPTIQDNIRSSKEEEYQGIFLTELFVNILGYTLKPNADFNLVAEYKNQTNSRKADGAILVGDVAIGVIELKGTNTKDLESIRKQAFDYKANQKGCVYVITSNFEKLRFYINDATEFEEFNLFELTLERFSLLYLCLEKNNIINNVPLKIKESSIVVEEQITKQFYKDYSLFKRELYRDLVRRNAKRLKLNRSAVNESNVLLTESQKAEQLQLEKNVKLTLFKKSQKLIDRYLFIFFAEDRGLLPPNSTQQILDKWKADLDFGDDRPLYDLFKQYFNFLDQGRKGTTSRAEIYAYNGGLFKEDTLLDGLEIDGELLYKHTCKLASYDFESQVDVNILGHIFENSLNEIESVNAEIEGGDFDKQKSKRKKDGVFYTPKYITKYIVENTIGKLCDEKKNELGFKEEEYFKGRKNRNKSTIEKLVHTLDVYRDWLLELTICDPACGSGAFLNQALDFLIKEHTYIDELKTKVLGGGLQFPDIENTILENNIYGVDLNEESVEIAKLSLWLRTAQPRRKLNDLSSNIKCGNSLIDSKAVAGDKAFNWQTEFPKVFEKGGFDVVIGNPPYVVYIKSIFGQSTLDYMNKHYKYSEYNPNTYALFTELSLNRLLKLNGYLGFIIPNSWLEGQYFSKMRQGIYNNLIEEIVYLKNSAFDIVVETVIIHIRNSNLPPESIKLTTDVKDNIYNNTSLDKPLFIKGYNPFIYSSNPLLEKLVIDFEKLSEHAIVYRGLETKNNKVWLSEIKKDKNYLPILLGRDVGRYDIEYTGTYVNFIQSEMKSNANLDMYLQPKILMRRTGSTIIATKDEDNLMVLKNSYLIIPDETYKLDQLLAQLNSSLFAFYHKSMTSAENKAFAQFKGTYILDFPISFDENADFANPVNEMIVLNSKLTKLKSNFKTYFSGQYNLTKTTRTLEYWYELDFTKFIKEINKAIRVNNKLRVKDGLEAVPVLTKKDEFEWLDLFEENKTKAQDLQTQINQTDKEIDAMVYELYGLSEEEILIVENS
ncbi:Eco57I restriction-modification methylase domain-containing protein [Formosa algae]|uniref:site-specific DNA-methyltransferase (adenine-specific) n=1 Tax=Formosa algae TaxID=225843 RepID=A0A9X1C861_9FLAO|nr:TaqI-like C-terminal specificity domain-containing protein [Formosa algae]MBP1838771.1 type I restriction-modification system DNA methylase subunit [Formosa algae]MDQ0335271.1 type I restriction-modification system DNA methylase subunit [Formosa algae]OEI79851.1 restriction endonuclease subunit M [Formosa algae]